MESKKVFIVVTITLCLVIGLQGFYVYRQYSEIQILTAKYTLLQADYSKLQIDYNELENRNRVLADNLSEVQREYDTLVSEHEAILHELDVLKATYDELVITHNQLKISYDSLYEQFFSLKAEYDEMLQTGFYLRDFTYSEVMKFIYSDPTNRNTYSEKYYCAHFCRDVDSNAAKIGLRCGVVLILMEDETGHAIVCFNTTDKDLIFIEPQTDEVVKLVIGEKLYSSWAKVKNFVIIW